MTEDGSIVINTKIRTDGIKAGTAEIEAGVHRAADRVRKKPQKQRKTTCHRLMKLIGTQQIRIPTQHRLDPM